jgi:hypothetical protein
VRFTAQELGWRGGDARSDPTVEIALDPLGGGRGAPIRLELVKVETHSSRPLP